MLSLLAGLKKIALGKDLKETRIEEINKSGLIILNSVSFSLAAVSVLFLVAFYINHSVSFYWFFLSEAVAFALIPILARKGYRAVSKFLLIAYVDVGIVILSAVFGKDMLIQTFLIPASGLSILLFDRRQLHLRNFGIGLSILCYLILDYIIFERVFISSDETVIVKWSILGAAFVTTWIVFNKFSESKDLAEEETRKLLKQTQKLNRELLLKQGELEDHLVKLEDAKKKVESGSKAKTEFLSMISHEIRTPMNAIIGMINLLAKDNPREDQLEQLEILDFSAKTLLSLITDVLDFSKIESGKIEFEKIAFDLHYLLQGVVESFRLNAEKKGITLTMKIEEPFTEPLIGDPARLTQILNNLVSNAVKFTREGGVTIYAKPIKKDRKHSTIQFKVEDTGVGILTDNQARIFESFTQERTDTSRIFGGTGLGLAISKKLIELQNGKIFLESTKDEGSTFFVEMEFTTGNKADIDRMNSETEDRLQDLRGAKVLVVEDNMINQKVMTRFLDRWNMEVTVASNGREALEQLKKENFHIVLMDLQMPVMDGYEASGLIRNMDDPKKRAVPIIALTAAALRDVKEQVYAAGMNDYLTKPFNPVELQIKLEQHILGKDK